MACRQKKKKGRTCYKQRFHNLDPDTRRHTSNEDCFARKLTIVKILIFDYLQSGRASITVTFGLFVYCSVASEAQNA